jgi:hypothetical protein
MRNTSAFQPRFLSKPIIFVGGISGSTNASTGYSVSLESLSGGVDSSPQTGDVVIVSIGVGSYTSGTPSISTSGYTQIATVNGTDDYVASLATYYKVMGETPDASISINGTGNPDTSSLCVIQVWRDVDISSPLDVSTTTASGGNTGVINPPSITPATIGSVILVSGVFGSGNAAIISSVSSGYSNSVIVSRNTSTDGSLGMGSKVWSSGVEDPGVYTISGDSTSNSWAAATMVLRAHPQSPTKVYYPLNGNSLDYSGNTNTGTDTAITYPQGRFGQAAKFNGSSSVIVVDPAPTLNLSATMTMCAWINVSSLPTAGQYWNIAGKGNFTGNTFSYYININNASGYALSLQCSTNGAAATFNEANAPFTPKLNRWHFISVVKSDANVSFYVDGYPIIPADSTTNATMYSSATPFRIGARDSADFFNGLIDEVIIESRAWTAKEVETYYRKSNLNYKQSKFAQFLQSINITDTMSLLDVTTGIRSRVVNITDTLGMTDTISAIRAYVVNLVDTMNLSETLTGLRTMALSITDSLGLTDSVNTKKRWDNQTKGTSTFSNQSKGTSTFSNQSKDSSSWTNQNKQL